MNLTQMIALTQELINARGPVGQEDEVRSIVRREMDKLCDEVWIDDADNVVGLVKGAPTTGKSKKTARAAASARTATHPHDPAIKVMAHMDELSLVVKRIDPDGSLRVRMLGGIYPWSFGLGPVEIMGDEGILPGVLSVGPLHATEESPDSWKAKVLGQNKALDWPQVRVFTRRSPAQLAKAGVHAGTRVVIAQSRRGLVEVGDCLAGYFLDDRVCITIMLAAAQMLKATHKRPAQDTYLVATCQEEIAGGAAAHAARMLPGALTLAIDVGPAAAEYGTKLSNDPIVAYRDARGVYTKSVCDRLMILGRRLNMQPQAAHWESYGSDASCSMTVGNTPRAGLLCIPTDNTHGFEIIPRGAIIACAQLLAEFLQFPA